MKYFAPFLLVSCSHSTFLQHPTTNLPLYQCSLPQIVVVAEDIPEVDVQVIKVSVDYWNEEMGQQVLLFGGRGGFASGDFTFPPNFIVVESSDVFFSPNGKGEMESRINHKGCMVGNIVRYDAKKVNRDDYSLHRIMRHELGHTLGLNHSLFRGDVMYSHQDRVIFLRRVRPELIEALKNIYGMRQK